MVLMVASLLCAPLAGDPMGGLDVLGLGGLVPAAQQQDEQITVAQEVDAVSKAVVDAQLGDPVPDGFEVARVAGDESVDPDQHSRCGRAILQFS
ncbi:MAG TPA: hypothetical protein VIS29_16640 [Streptomyces sp.]